MKPRGILEYPMNSLGKMLVPTPLANNILKQSSLILKKGRKKQKKNRRMEKQNRNEILSG
jgi:hypothetical protein